MDMLMDSLKAFGPKPPSGRTQPMKGKVGGVDVTMYNKDLADMFRWGLIGAVGMGVYQMGMRMSNRNILPGVDLKDPNDCIASNPTILESFVEIQPYRRLDKASFKMAIQNVDNLLLREYGLRSGEITAMRKDKVEAFSYFRVAIKRLGKFSAVVEDRLGHEHALVVKLQIKRIFKEMQNSFSNILTFCSKFNPEELLRRAPEEIDKIIDQMDSNSEYPEPDETWEQFRRNCPSRQRGSHRRHHQ
jgi:hypothetical protein